MWNGPIDGNYSNCDFTKPPWAAGVAELTHEEVLFVIENIAPIEAEFLPDTNTVIGKYNQLTGYEKAINGDSYVCIKSYDPEINKWGINANGIVPDPTEVTEQPQEQTEPIINE